VQVVAKPIGGTIVVNCTIAMCIALPVMIILFITKTIQSTIGAYGAVKVRVTFSIERVFIAVSINFAIRIAGTMPVIMAGDVRPGSWVSWANLDQATLKCEARKYD